MNYGHWISLTLINDSEIGNGFQSADTFDLDGDRNKVLGNMFSRYPKNSGSLSANYSKEVSADREVFARMQISSIPATCMHPMQCMLTLVQGLKLI